MKLASHRGVLHPWQDPHKLRIPAVATAIALVAPGTCEAHVQRGLSAAAADRHSGSSRCTCMLALQECVQAAWTCVSVLSSALVCSLLLKWHMGGCRLQER
jgi:hypothetical protein